MPILYKYLALLGVALAIFGAGWYSGYSPQHDKLVSYKAQVAQAAKDQEIAVKAKEKEHDAQTAYVADSYSNYYQQLLTRLRDAQRRSSGLPQTASGPQGADGTQQELSRACQGSQFYSNALEDALKLQHWQEWAARQNIPVVP